MRKKGLGIFLFLLSFGIFAAEYQNCIAIMGPCAICHGENSSGQTYDIVICNFPMP